MNFEEIKQIVEKVDGKLKEIARFEKLKTYIDERTDPTGAVVITVEKETFSVGPTDLKALLDNKIQANDTTADLTDLKNKAK